MVALLLNHAIVDGMAIRRDETTAQLKALRRTLDAARIVSPQSALYVHDQIWRHKPDGTTDLYTWGSQHVNEPEWKDALLGLLRACTEGPYLSTLPCDTSGPPSNIMPAIARPDLTDVVSTGLHHCLSDATHVAFVLSYGASSETLPALRYEGIRAPSHATLQNHHNESAASAALDSLARKGLATRRDVLKHVESICPKVRILERVYKSIDSAHIDVPLSKLLIALVGFESYARAMIEGRVPKHEYEAKTGIEISDESITVYNKPSLRKQFEFDVPGHGKQYFGYHSKIGASTRIHIWSSVVTEKDSGGNERRAVTIWIGRIDAHPKGARG